MNNKELMEDLQELTIEEVVKKYDLTFNDLFKLSKQIYSNSNPEDVDFTGKYVRKTKSGTYSIVKSVNGENVYFGSYGDKAEAYMVRDNLIECGWDKDQLPIILCELDIKSKKGTDVWEKEF